ncbi:sugar O-acetyltransferase [Chitiniphilus eburneus]|uniref:Nodulation protein L n=1 Tax=Chitiniphilus eburneus TaxID=2571148 RepID=A0A4U0PEJ0_9NEIS|nr:sugar O-acetyltransferase [Chitiniphilus eburneus]TJZ65442.1 sugar O-acetyltransferase [Chitiniphilus eburneus]
MPTERQKMIAGEPYDALDPALVEARVRARSLCRALGTLDPVADAAEYRRLLDTLFQAPTDAFVTPPFFCEYGDNTTLGENVYFNTQCVIIDVAPVSIGHGTLIGPAVQIYTATHPTDLAGRRRGIESGKPVVIGAEVWLGGAVVICPGVTIGDGSVIGAGSVVTRDVPPGVLAAGNPCRVIRVLHDGEAPAQAALLR